MDEHLKPMIHGVQLHQLSQIDDERGAVLHMMRSDLADFTSFGECYFSEILPGKVKAWKSHTIQTQNLVVPVGRVKFVIYDERVASTTYKKLQVIELGRPEHYFRLTIPPKLWYGFMCIGDTPALIANCTDLPHNQAEGERRLMTDSAIPYQWEI